MTWEIKIPFQDRSQTIAEALAAGLDHTALEPGEDRDVTREGVQISEGLLPQPGGFEGSAQAESQTALPHERGPRIAGPSQHSVSAALRGRRQRHGRGCRG